MSDKFDDLIRTGRDTDAMRYLAQEYYQNGKIGHTRKLLMERVADRLDRLQAELLQLAQESVRRELVLAKLEEELEMALREDYPESPLTLDELRHMNGSPVWIASGRFWALVKVVGDEVLLTENSGEIAKAKGWMKHMGSIYRRPVKEGAK